MAMLRDATMTLLMSVLAFVQLFVFSLLAFIYVPVLIIVGVLNIIYKMLTGSSFENIDLLIEPLRWAFHQTRVLVAAEDEFWAVPYLGM